MNHFFVQCQYIVNRVNNFHLVLQGVFEESTDLSGESWPYGSKTRGC